MTRKRRGRPVSGWVLVDKPPGLTSTDVVTRIRRIFDAQKAGHAGTLDPAATGLLAVALGEATKTVPQVADSLKAYSFRVRFGAATRTDDAEGEIIATSQSRPGNDDITHALAGFRGQILQVPPQFSAVKVEGARAYDLARAGESLALEARPLWVERLEMTARPDRDHADFEMVCGKGGYVRAIARDLGQQLGSYGHVVALRRLWSGPFALESSSTLAQLQDLTPEEAAARHLLPLESALSDLPQTRATALGRARLSNGNPGEVIPPPGLEPGDEAWASHDGRAIAIGRYLGGQLHPSRVFNL